MTEDGPDIGRTIRSADGDPIDVATSADGGMFEGLLLRTLDDVRPDEPLVEPSPADGDAVVEPSPADGDAVVAYNGTDCSYDGPTTVTAGRVGFTFETNDSTWVAAIIQLTGEFTIGEVVTWLEANPDSQEAPPGVEEVILVPPGDHDVRDRRGAWRRRGLLNARTWPAAHRRLTRRRVTSPGTARPYPPIQRPVTEFMPRCRRPPTSFRAPPPGSRVHRAVRISRPP